MHTDMIQNHPLNKPLLTMTPETPTPSQVVPASANWELIVAEKSKIATITPAYNKERYIGSVVLEARAYTDVGSAVIAPLAL